VSASRTRPRIVGIGQTAFGRGLPDTPSALAIDASLAAIADAGVEVGDIDGVCRFTSPFESVAIPDIVRGLGLTELSFFAESPLGGEALGAVVAHAAHAIGAGQARNVLVYRSLSQSRLGRFGRADEGPGAHGGATAAEDVVVGEAGNNSFSWPYGLLSPGNLFALTVNRYRHEFGVPADRLAEAMGTVAVQQRAYANRNPRAIMRDRPLTMEQYLASRVISSPLRLFDLCLENDGAVAFVLSASGDRTATGRRGVAVLSATQSLSPYSEPMGIYTEDPLEPFPSAVRDRLYGRAGLTPEDVDVAELYDATSFMTLRGLETYGFVPHGSGWRHLLEQGVGPDAPLPVNTHGGHLSEGYLHGMNALLEGVRQLRGESVNQIRAAEIALVGAPSGSAVLLGV